MKPILLVIDQGTTSTRAMAFSQALAPLAMAQQELTQFYPAPGWVEHDPEELWQSVLTTGRLAMKRAGVDPRAVGGIGIANQRETTLVWDRTSGHAVGRAIVWQDRRTAEACTQLEAKGYGARVRQKTGLRLDPYFAASKLAWMLDNIAGVRASAEAGRLAFGTVETFLLWRLTEGRVHATDASNAARTLLCDIRTGRWDDEMLALWRIPRAVLPEIRDNAADFGATTAFGGTLAIRGMAGDQQAALIGQGCVEPGMAKATYGTGAFLLTNTGDAPVTSSNRLLATIAWQLGGDRVYALEGAIFNAGSAVTWLRDGLGVIGAATEADALAAAADPAQRVYLVPAFTGLGAPHWRAEARGLITGITRATTRRELARAALEAVGYQTRDLLAGMAADLAPCPAATMLRVDGGMAASDWTMQFLADQLGIEVAVPEVTETTALGAAYLAGLTAGLCPPPADYAAGWRPARCFTPSGDEAVRATAYAGWQAALRQTLQR